MIFKQTKIKITVFCRLMFTSLLVISCAEKSTTQVTNNTNDLSSTINDANLLYCPVDSENKQLDLTHIKLERQQNIPLMYEGYNNIEGPVWHNGALYYSNMGSHQPNENGFQLTNQATIWRWVPGNKPQIWIKDTTAGTNGLALDNNSNLVAGRQLDGSLSTIDWQTKKITPIATTYQNKRFNSPNDLTIAYDDTIYFTDPNWNTPSDIILANVQGGGQQGSIEPGQRVYRVKADGTLNATAVTELVPALRDKPNGIILSLDQEQLIVGGLQGLWVFDLTLGEVSNPQQLLDTPIDGLGKDCSGNIYITTTREMTNRKDAQVVVILDKNHLEIGSLNVLGIQIATNIAFGGNDGKTLFVTGLTAPMAGDKLRQCGDKTCLKASIYTTNLNVQGFPF
tara:strand:+ start:94 stop:1281 length:1188 start_codon:yes stop_codon:yes gene_type:complete